MQNKKIILIGDDIRQPTGVGNILRSISLKLSNKYDIVQIAAGLQPNEVIDLSDSVSKVTGNDSVYFKMYGTNDYGSLELLRNVIKTETVDCILIMTDPHKFEWLFNSEHEIRSICPIFYYHVWDNKPYPQFLKRYYDSCDTISCISKLTHECVRNVAPDHPRVFYTPHGVNTHMYQPQTESTITKNRKDFLGQDYKFVLFFNGTNIPRKEITTIIAGFNDFYHKLNTDDKKEVTLLIHSNSKSTRGVNINALLDDLYTNLPVLLSDELVNEQVLNNMYNLSHCVINISSNEGFGLSTLESVATKTPIIVNKTGGLIDQINEKWTYPITPEFSLMRGTQKTPYIYSDYVSIESTSDAIMSAFKNKSPSMDSYLEFLKENKFTSDDMCQSVCDQVDQTISSYETPSRYKFEKIK